ncbi:hypothetical protein CE91St30_09430 [Raoultibacter timonensis]|uniref:Uncharacterized protein n=1 Tax=Raoultibacter timonensis TaxID=1907662 RepID=A0ABM7WH85_9ACTN|nr:hypothetical protein CE91St30_09430 [Raoultibacter timonensis]BDF50214.1 hypothetical protein CE91St31_09440 [Raoultibacter timonensis]
MAAMLLLHFVEETLRNEDDDDEDDDGHDDPDSLDRNSPEDCFHALNPFVQAPARGAERVEK